MAQPQQTTKPQTIVINNFGGRLTRILNGDLNSGFSKFAKSWGYDPFSKPMNLTWLETPASIAGISDLVLATKNRYEAAQIVYGIGSSGKAYRIQPTTAANPNLDSVIGIGSVTAGSQTYNYGASIEFFGTPSRMYVGGDRGINSLPVTSVVTGVFGGDTFLGNANQYVASHTRPLAQFAGKLLFGNGPTIGAISATNTITSSIIGLSVGTSGSTQNIYSELDPPLPPENTIQDLDVAPDFSYLYMSASELPSEDLLTIGGDRIGTTGVNSGIYKWNGSDFGVTAGIMIPALSARALQTYLQQNIIFSNDPYGTAVGTETQKQLTLPNNRAPFRNATGVNGNFVYWTSPEVVNGASIVGSLYYFGQLDQENPAGLYRLMRYNTNLAAGYVYQIPVCQGIENKYEGVNNAITSIASMGLGKHYISTMEINGGTTQYKFLRFLITPSGSGTPQTGVYETQTQLFSKRIGLAQIRVYTEPVVSGNAFQLDLIGSDGAVIPNGTFNYTFGDPVDKNERINFNPNINTLYALGVRITNTGTTNMTIKKIEIDYDEEGK